MNDNIIDFTKHKSSKEIEDIKADQINKFVEIIDQNIESCDDLTYERICEIFMNDFYDKLDRIDRKISNIIQLMTVCDLFEEE